MSIDPGFLSEIAHWNHGAIKPFMARNEIESRGVEGQFAVRLYRGSKQQSGLPRNDGRLHLAVSVHGQGANEWEVDDPDALAQIGAALAAGESMLPVAIAATPEAIELLKKVGSFHAAWERWDMGRSDASA